MRILFIEYMITSIFVLMNSNDYKELKNILSTPKNIVIIPHKNPDGDAMGSTLGLMHYLQQYNHHITIIAPNEYPEFLHWLPSNDQVVIYDNEIDKAEEIISNSELIFTLDFNHFGRCGNLQKPLELAKHATFVMIDHHQQPDTYAKFTYSDVSICSTCQMVYHFIENLNDLEKINEKIATCLYTGIMTDTGSFRFRSTSSTTHRVIANLIDNGAKNASIHESIYDTNTLSRLQLKGVALNNLKVLPEYKTAFISLSQKELNQNGYKKGDTDGFVNIGLSLNDINFAVLFTENEAEGIIKISFRSKGSFSVNKFARTHFEGGGHDNAAGGKSDYELQETISKFLSILPSYKQEIVNS